ncbi:MAG: glycerol-3-phosphate acyltransferase [bacterium]
MSSFLVWLTLVVITRYSSLGSITASLWATIVVILYQLNIINFEIFKIKFQNKILLTFFTAFLTAFIIYKHRENIKRILKGQENKLF